MIVELPDGRELDVPDTITPAQKQAIQQKLREKYSVTTTPTTEDSALERGAGYLAKKGTDWMGAVSRLGQVRSPMEMASDWATAAAPVLAPGLTAAGVAAGTTARTAGADPETAGLVETGVNLAGGVGSALSGAARGAAGLRPGINAQFAGVRDTMAARGTLLPADSPEGQQLFWRLARATSRFTGTGRPAARNIMRMLARGDSPTYGDIDDALTAVQGSARPSAIAGILRGARDAMAEGTPEADVLRSAYGQTRLARMSLPHGAARVAAGAAGLSGAGYEAYHGRYGRAASALALGATGAGASVGHLAAAGRGAAGPAARAGLSFMQTPGVQSMLQPSEDASADTGAPEDIPEASATADMAATGTPRTQPQPSRDYRSIPTDEWAGMSLAERQAAMRGTPTPQATPRASSGPYGREIDAVAKLVGVPAPLLRGVMTQESGGNPNAVSYPEADQAQTPAHGLMQITPGTFEIHRREAEALLGRKASIGNPLDNLLMAGLLYRNYLDKTGGDVAAAARLYFGGGGTGPRTRQYGEDIARQYERASR